LQTPSEIVLIEMTWTLLVEAGKNFMQKSHSIDTSLGQQMLYFFFKSKLIDNLVFNDRLVELLLRRVSSKNKP